MKLRIYPKSPAPRHISQIAETLRNGGLVILPTDGVYAITCAANQPKAIEKLSKLKTNRDNQQLSFLFSDLAMVSDYTKPVTKDQYKLMNRVLPGPFTFILNSGGPVHKIFPHRKTIGVRIPDHQIPLGVIHEMGIPLLTASVHDQDDLIEYTTDPELIIRNWEGRADLIVDGGYGNLEPSTVIDCTTDTITMIRQGIGEIDEMLV